MLNAATAAADVAAAGTAKVRVSLSLAHNAKDSRPAVIPRCVSLVDLLKLGQAKLRSKVRRVFRPSGEELLGDGLFSIEDGEKLYFSKSALYSPNTDWTADQTEPPATADDEEKKQENPIVSSCCGSPTLPEATEVRFFTHDSHRDTDAENALLSLGKEPSVRKLFGMPDLHPGSPYPIGAAVCSQGQIFPHLIGGDIGCGMSLVSTHVNVKAVGNKKKIDKLAATIDDMERPWHDAAAWRASVDLSVFSEAGIDLEAFDNAIGTVGGGNHFAELVIVEEVIDEEAFAALNLSAKHILLMVHSGSRGLGKAVLDCHTKTHGTKGLEADSPQAQAYIRQHDACLQWASRNRALIAQRLLAQIGAYQRDCQCVLDVPHNFVASKAFPSDGVELFIHRKGAAPSDSGPVIVPGSRGDFSYLVLPKERAESGFSIAHGAGRKQGRVRGGANMKQRFPNPRKLLDTDLGSTVICEDRETLYAEAPLCYKAIDDVMNDMVRADLVTIVAKLRPVITYKMRK